MSRIVLLQKYESQMRNKENELKDLEKNISRFNKTSKDFKFEKLKLENELVEVRKDILKAGAKYDSSLVVALKNKEGRIRTKINEVNNILILFNKVNQLKNEILELKKLIEDFKPLDNEREQMNIVLKALRNNYSYEDATKLANIEVKRMINWIHEGRNKTNKNKIYFFKQYSRIKSSKTRKIEKLLKHLKNGKTKVEACKLSYISVKAFDTWYNYGKLGKDKINIDFYNQVQIINGK